MTRLISRLRRAGMSARPRAPKRATPPPPKHTISRPTRFEPALPKLVLFSICALSLAAGGLLTSRARAKERNRFQLRADEFATALGARVAHYVDGVRACGGLFAASQDVSAREFRRFVGVLDVARRYPGIEGLGWAVVVGRRPLRTSIRYFEPADPRIRPALGADMYAEPVRREAMDRAMESGGLSATDRVVLIADGAPDEQFGFLIYAPVYRAGAALDSAERRRAAIEGFVYAPFRAGDFFSGLRAPPELGFRLFDEGGPGGGGAIFARGDPGACALRARRAVDVAGRAWTIEIGSPEQLSGFERWEGALIAALGVLLGGVLFRLLSQAERRARELRGAVAARRESEARFRLVADAAPALIWLAGLDRGMAWLNRRWPEYTGRAIETDLGFGWTEAVHPEDRTKQLETFHDAFDARRPFVFELRLRRADGAYRWHRNHGVPISGPAGEFSGYVGACVDVHESRELEKELALRVAERTAELESANRELESFAYSVSHDLRAPLRTIEGFSAVLLRRMGDRLGQEEAGYLQRIRNGVERMGWIIDDVLKLSRLTRLAPQVREVDLSEAARAAAADAARAHPHPVALTIQPGMRATADPALLRLALDNLLSNAYKYSSKTPNARVEVGGVEGVFFVRDNGAGFEMAHYDKLFQPFTRLHTREEFEGTGVGLAIVKRIVERHGGRVWAESAVGLGTTMRFTLGAVKA